MKLESAQLGSVEYEDSDLIRFEEGLYGFAEAKEFIIVGQITEEFPFMWLQSVQTPELAFIITSPFLFVEDYDFELPEAVTIKMGLQSIEDVQVFNLTVIPEEVGNTTINLKAPIIINRNTKSAKQVILNENYPYKHRIFKSE